MKYTVKQILAIAMALILLIPNFVWAEDSIIPEDDDLLIDDLEMAGEEVDSSMDGLGGYRSR